MANVQPPLLDPEYRSGYNDYRYEKDKGLIEMFLTWHKRLNRLRYLKRALALVAVETILAMVIGFATMDFAANDLSTTGYVLMSLMFIAFAPLHYMLIIRRLHDLNKTGWFALIMLIPVVNTIFSLYLLFAPGTIGSNDYGADPIECVD
ncbi:MAG: DUF805 domain-containing protein [Selenomonadaceae bacterium]|nr:DUF805 domain-containing protein [Selenomonadaceae bacterium]